MRNRMLSRSLKRLSLRLSDFTWMSMAKSVCGAVIGAVRRECLDRMLVFGEAHL